MSIPRSLIALGLILAAARADVVVVDPGGAPGAPILMQAIADAAPGDVLLLEPGNYQQDYLVYSIDKGLALLPASVGGRITLGPVQISNVPAGQSIVLRGLDLNAFADATSALLISQVHGTAWIEDCHIAGSHPSLDSGAPGPGGIAVSVFQAHVIFRHCSLAGGAGMDGVAGQPSSTGGDAFFAASLSHVALHDCTLVGGDAGSGLPPILTDLTAGRALNTGYSDVLVSGCTLTGGKEGADNDAQPGTSGSAIRTADRASVRVLQSVLLPGAVQGLGTQAPTIDGAPSTVEMLAEPARALVLPALAHVGQVVTLFLDGEPGDAAFLLMSPKAGAWPVARLEGTLALQPGSFAAPVFVGVLPGPDGQLSAPFSITQLPPGVEAMTLFAQGLFQDADGASLGGASAITWLDAGP
jgi:hypothetical protein